MCLAPPLADSAANLEATTWNQHQQPVPFYDYVSFSCLRGMKFEEDFDQISVEVQCQPGNMWNSPATNEWPKCVPSKNINNVAKLLGHGSFSQPSTAMTPLPPGKLEKRQW